MEKDPFNPNNKSMPSQVIPQEVLNPTLKKTYDPTIIRKPEMPIQGPIGRGGRISQSGTFAKFIMSNLNRNEQRDQDPREALLNVAKEAAADPIWIGPAYLQTQPKAIFNMTPSTWEAKRGEEIKKLVGANHKKCARCGLKMCTCSKK